MLKTVKNILNNHLYAISLYLRQIAGTFILFLIAHYLSVFDYGLFSSYKNIAVACFMFANLGYADYILVSSSAKVQEVKLKISLFLFNAIFIGIVSILSSYCFNLDSHFLFALVIIRTFFDGTFFALILPYFQAKKDFRTISYINLLYSTGIVIIALLSFFLKLSLTKFLLLNIGLGLINFIQCSLYAKINYLLVFNYLKRFIKMVDKGIFAYVGVTLAYFLYAQIPALYVSTFIAKEQVALYFSAYTISNIIALLISAQVQKMLPEMINKDTVTAKHVIRTNLKFILIATSIVFLFMILFGKYLLLLLYGQQYYTQAYLILLIQTFGNICVAEAAIYGAYITASGNQKRKIPMQLKASVVTILGLFIFHRYGILGATLAYLFATIYTAYLYTTFTIKLLKQQKMLENNLSESVAVDNTQ